MSIKKLTPKELEERLESHVAWLRGYGDERADLRDCDLSRSNLSGSDLSDCNLSRSDLRYCDLSGSDLRDCVGLLLLPVQDMRGYSFAHAIETDRGWRIRAGCRDFSIDEARAHWGDSYKGDREQGDMYLYAIDWLEKKLGESR